jgi:hypothetical protein
LSGSFNKRSNFFQSSAVTHLQNFKPDYIDWLSNLTPAMVDALFESIIALQTRLNDEGIASIVIGGVAIGAWGEPRLTRDVDLKIMLRREDAQDLLTILGDEYISLVPNPVEMLQKQALVFVQDSRATRLDLLLADTTYDEIAIQRGGMKKYSLVYPSGYVAQKI